MLTNSEREEIYDQRYASQSGKWHGRREEQLYRVYRKLLLKWSISDCKDKTYLDLGCGTGSKTIGFSEGFRQVMAIDLSGKSVELCRNQYGATRVNWVKGDAMAVEGKFDLITAFGFSLFNTPDNEVFLENVGHIIARNLSEEGGTMLIGSFTDGSGSGDSWYMHSPGDLNYIVGELEKRHRVKAEVIFPYRYMLNYLGGGFLHFLFELKKRLTGRRRNFFIKIVYG